MKLAVISNFVPDGRPLSEHAFHFVRGLRSARSGSLVQVLAGRHDGQNGDGEVRCWDYGSPWIAQQMLDGIRAVRPDLVLFNAHFTAWGGNLANFAALVAPLLARRAGWEVATLLHHLPHTINAQVLGYRLTPAHHVAIELACRAIARAGATLFTTAHDFAAFQRYRPLRSARLPLGLQGEPSWRPLPATRRVLTFGNWGRSKDPLPVIQAAVDSRADFELVVAGGSSHTRPGYIEGLRATFHRFHQVRFTGYVPELAVPALFHQARLVVLPYKENTGASSVLMQTCQYGRVPILTHLPYFKSTVKELGIQAYFYDGVDDLRALVEDLLDDPERLTRAGYHNYRLAHNLAMPVVANDYWEVLEGGRGTEAPVPVGSAAVAQPAQLPAV